MSIRRLIAPTVLTGIAALLLPVVSCADGKRTYEQACKACHGAGVGAAPRYGDKVAWAPRITKGLATLQEHALHGFKDKGVMAPKGGRLWLSDDEVNAAVVYIVDGSQ